MTWQPIETAPKDGSAILAASRHHEHVEVVCWQDGLPSGSREAMDSPDEPEEGWVNSGAVKDRFYANPRWFTHWAPLPPNPAERGDAVGPKGLPSALAQDAPQNSVSDHPDLAELKRVAEAATPGPWQNGIDDLEGIVAPDAPGLGNVVCIPPLKKMYDSLQAWPDNARFIATFDPPTVLALIHRVETAERELVETRDRWARAGHAASERSNQLQHALNKNRELEADLARAREALEPFKAIVPKLLRTPDHRPLDVVGNFVEHDDLSSGGRATGLKAADFRRAAEVHASLSGGAK